MDCKVNDAFAFFGFKVPEITPIKKQPPRNKKKYITSCAKCIALHEGNTANDYVCRIYGHLETLKITNLDRVYELGSTIPIKSTKCSHKVKTIGELQTRLRMESK